MKTLKQYLKESSIPKNPLYEASLGRLRQHLEAGEPIAIISACRSDWNRKDPKENAKINKAKTNELRSFILGMGFGFNRAIGGYTEIDSEGNKVEIKDEMSCIVYATPDREKELRTFAIGMGKRFKQDSILFVNTKKEAEWIFTRPDNFMGKPVASSFKLGDFHYTQLDKYFTKIGKKNFSFAVESVDCRKWTQLSEEMSIPTTIEMRGFDFMRKELAKCAEQGIEWAQAETVWTD